MKLLRKRAYVGLLAQIDRLKTGNARLAVELAAVTGERDRLHEKVDRLRGELEDTASMRAGYSDLRDHLREVEVDLAAARGHGSFEQRAASVERELRRLHSDAYRAGEHDFANAVRRGLRGFNPSGA